jgi:hypothetical protein
VTNIYHNLACEKGFHDNDEFDEQGKPTPRQLLAWAALICSEWFEWRAECDAWYLREDGKPEGTIAELADVFIRCQDIGYLLGDEDVYGRRVDGSKLVWHALCSSLIEASRMVDLEGCLSSLHGMVAFVEARAAMDIENFQLCDVDGSPKTFAEAIAAKHEFNKTRPHRHGKKA